MVNIFYPLHVESFHVPWEVLFPFTLPSTQLHCCTGIDCFSMSHMYWIVHTEQSRTASGPNIATVSFISGMKSDGFYLLGLMLVLLFPGSFIFSKVIYHPFHHKNLVHFVYILFQIFYFRYFYFRNTYLFQSLFFRTILFSAAAYLFKVFIPISSRYSYIPILSYIRTEREILYIVIKL